MLNYLTGEEVISGVARKLRDGFTTTEFPEIYKNTPKQGAAKSYIFIAQDGVKTYPGLRGYMEMNFLINVKFIHSADMDKEDEWARTCSFRAMEYLRWINIGTRLSKAQDMSSRVIDDFLCITCRYTFRVLLDDQSEKQLMENVSSGIKLK